MPFKNNSRSVAKPSGFVTGDLLLCSLAITDGSATVSNIVPPSGWTAAYINYGSWGCFGFYYKWATASEPSTYTFTWTGLSEGIIDIGYRSASSVNSSDLFDVHAYQEFSSAAGVFTTPAMTTSLANELVISAFFARSASTFWTLPTSPAETAFGNSPQGWIASDGHGANICSGYETIAAAGSVSGRTATNSNNPNYGGAFIIALKPPGSTSAPIFAIRSLQQVRNGSSIGGKVFHSWAYTKAFLGSLFSLWLQREGRQILRLLPPVPLPRIQRTLQLALTLHFARR